MDGNLLVSANKMASETAKALARDVIAAHKKGGKIVMGKMAENRGYSQTVIDTPSKATNTKSYQKEIKPFLQRLIGLRDKIATELERKDLTKVQFEALSRALQGIIHDIQLIGGKATERIAGVKITLRK